MDKKIFEKCRDIAKAHANEIVVGAAIIGYAALFAPTVARMERRTYATTEQTPVVNKKQTYKKLVDNNDWMCETSTVSIMESYREYQAMKEFE